MIWRWGCWRLSPPKASKSSVYCEVTREIRANPSKIRDSFLSRDIRENHNPEIDPGNEGFLPDMHLIGQSAFLFRVFQSSVLNFLLGPTDEQLRGLGGEAERKDDQQQVGYDERPV